MKSGSVDLIPGTVLGVERRFYDHYGVFVEGGEVIHYTSEGSDIGASNKISRTSFDRFLRGRESFWITKFPDRKRAEKILRKRIETSVRSGASFVSGFRHKMTERFVKEALKNYRLYTLAEVQRRALKRLGQKKYNLVTNNCEHFVFWCATGVASSPQVEILFYGGKRFLEVFSKSRISGERESRESGRFKGYIPLSERTEPIDATHFPRAGLLFGFFMPHSYVYMIAGWKTSA